MTSPIESAYSQWSATYDTDRNLTRDLDHAVTRSLLAGRRYDTALELGCGTGKNTAFLATVSSRVHALDFSEGMLAQARAKNLPAHVTFAQADLTAPWPVAERSFDLLTCNLVLEHIQDLRPIFAQAARALRPAGTFLVSELHPFRQYLGTRARFTRDDTQTHIPAFTHHVSEFLAAASGAGLSLATFQEPLHPDDQDKPPRLAVFLFNK